MQEYERVGKAFVSHYYGAMSGERCQLEGLYGDNSCMTFEGSQVKGMKPIMAKLGSLSFKTVRHLVTTCDCQPAAEVSGGDGVFITVMGQLQTDEDQPQSFVQSFLLGKSGGSYYVANEIFRLVVHDS